MATIITRRNVRTLANSLRDRWSGLERVQRVYAVNEHGVNPDILFDLDNLTDEQLYARRAELKPIEAAMPKTAYVTRKNYHYETYFG